jgi:hypothetical protein
MSEGRNRRDNVNTGTDQLGHRARWRGRLAGPRGLGRPGWKLPARQGGGWLMRPRVQHNAMLYETAKVAWIE